MPTATTATDIGSAIAAARKAAGLSQQKLAVLAHTTQAKVSQIEGGKETARLSIVLKLIAAAGLVIDLQPVGKPASGTSQTRTANPSNIVLDEPLPDDTIDLDAIVGGPKPKITR